MLNNHSVLRAAPGERLVIKGHHVGEPERDAEILEVLGEDGGPPFVVRWQGGGRISRLYPSSDAYVEHFEHKRRRASARRKKGPTRPSRAAEEQVTAADWEAAVPPKDS